MERRRQDLVFGVLVAAVLAFGVFVVLVASGHFVTDEASPSAKPSNAVSRPVTPLTPPPPAVTRATRVPAVASVRLVASRGDCWVSARSGTSSDGPVLAEQLLGQGQSLTLRGRKVWLSLGAPANVDVSVNGRRRAIPAGAASVVLG